MPVPLSVCHYRFVCRRIFFRNVAVSFAVCDEAMNDGLLSWKTLKHDSCAWKQWQYLYTFLVFLVFTSGDLLRTCLRSLFTDTSAVQILMEVITMQHPVSIFRMYKDTLLIRAPNPDCKKCFIILHSLSVSPFSFAPMWITKLNQPFFSIVRNKRPFSCSVSDWRYTIMIHPTVSSVHKFHNPPQCNCSFSSLTQMKPKKMSRSSEQIVAKANTVGKDGACFKEEEKDVIAQSFCSNWLMWCGLSTVHGINCNLAPKCH